MLDMVSSTLMLLYHLAVGQEQPARQHQMAGRLAGHHSTLAILTPIHVARLYTPSSWQGVVITRLFLPVSLSPIPLVLACKGHDVGRKVCLQPYRILPLNQHHHAIIVINIGTSSSQPSPTAPPISIIIRGEGRIPEPLFPSSASGHPPASGAASAPSSYHH